jgi:prevent-host-death family protein
MAVRYETISAARKCLADLAREPRAEVVITQGGRPSAVLLGIETYRSLQALANLAGMPRVLEAAMAEHRRFQADEAGDALTLEELRQRLAAAGGGESRS